MMLNSREKKESWNVCLERPYLKRLALERKNLGRKDVLTAIKHRASAAEVRDAVEGHEMFVDPAVNDRRHIGCDGDIVVGYVDVGELGNFKKIGTDLDALAGGSDTRSLDVLGEF
jgi:hypothetical protein